jgi:hypothetical protein
MFNWKDIKIKCIIAVIWFFVGAGVMFLALSNKLFLEVPIKTSLKDAHDRIRRSVQ